MYFASTFLPSNTFPKRLSENGYFSQSLRQAQIIILEILKCIPVVMVFAFLDLEQTILFSDKLHNFETQKNENQKKTLKNRKNRSF